MCYTNLVLPFWGPYAGNKMRKFASFFYKSPILFFILHTNLNYNDMINDYVYLNYIVSEIVISILFFIQKIMKFIEIQNATKLHKIPLSFF